MITLDIKGKQYNIFDTDKDFGEAIREHMGIDAEKYFLDLMNEYDLIYDEVERLRKQITISI